MIEYLSLETVLDLHEEIITVTGGGPGLRDNNGLESAVANPGRTFSGQDLYPTLIEKAGILLWSLVRNHPSSMATSGLDTLRLNCSYG